MLYRTIRTGGHTYTTGNWDGGQVTIEAGRTLEHELDLLKRRLESADSTSQGHQGEIERLRKEVEWGRKKTKDLDEKLGGALTELAADNSKAFQNGGSAGSGE